MKRKRFYQWCYLNYKPCGLISSSYVSFKIPINSEQRYKYGRPGVRLGFDPVLCYFQSKDLYAIGAEYWGSDDDLKREIPYTFDIYSVDKQQPSNKENITRYSDHRYFDILGCECEIGDCVVTSAELSYETVLYYSDSAEDFSLGLLNTTIKKIFLKNRGLPFIKPLISVLKYNRFKRIPNKYLVLSHKVYKESGVKLKILLKSNDVGECKQFVLSRSDKQDLLIISENTDLSTLNFSRDDKDERLGTSIKEESTSSQRTHSMRRDGILKNYIIPNVRVIEKEGVSFLSVKGKLAAAIGSKGLIVAHRRSLNTIMMRDFIYKGRSVNDGDVLIQESINGTEGEISNWY